MRGFSSCGQLPLYRGNGPGSSPRPPSIYGTCMVSSRYVWSGLTVRYRMFMSPCQSLCGSAGVSVAATIEAHV